MPSRVDEAWDHDPRALWALIIEDEDTANAPELGEISERLFVNAQQAWAENARLRADVHSLAGQLTRERRLNRDLGGAGEQVLPGPGAGAGQDHPVLRVHVLPEGVRCDAGG